MPQGPHHPKSTPGNDSFLRENQSKAPASDEIMISFRHVFPSFKKSKSDENTFLDSADHIFPGDLTITSQKRNGDCELIMEKFFLPFKVRITSSTFMSEGKAIDRQVYDSLSSCSKPNLQYLQQQISDAKASNRGILEYRPFPLIIGDSLNRNVAKKLQPVSSSVIAESLRVMEIDFTTIDNVDQQFLYISNDTM